MEGRARKGLAPTSPAGPGCPREAPGVAPRERGVSVRADLCAGLGSRQGIDIGASVPAGRYRPPERLGRSEVGFPADDRRRPTLRHATHACPRRRPQSPQRPGIAGPREFRVPPTGGIPSFGCRLSGDGCRSLPPETRRIAFSIDTIDTAPCRLSHAVRDAAKTVSWYR